MDTFHDCFFSLPSYHEFKKSITYSSNLSAIIFIKMVNLNGDNHLYNGVNLTCVFNVAEDAYDRLNITSQLYQQLQDDNFQITDLEPAGYTFNLEDNEVKNPEKSVKLIETYAKKHIFDRLSIVETTNKQILYDIKTTYNTYILYNGCDTNSAKKLLIDLVNNPPNITDKYNLNLYYRMNFDIISLADNQLNIDEENDKLRIGLIHRIKNFPNLNQYLIKSINLIPNSCGPKKIDIDKYFLQDNTNKVGALIVYYNAFNSIILNKNRDGHVFAKQSLFIYENSGQTNSVQFRLDFDNITHINELKLIKVTNEKLEEYFSPDFDLPINFIIYDILTLYNSYILSDYNNMLLNRYEKYNSNIRQIFIKNVKASLKKTISFKCYKLTLLAIEYYYRLNCDLLNIKHIQSGNIKTDIKKMKTQLDQWIDNL